MKIFAEPVIPPGYTSCESDEFTLSDAPVSLQITPDDWKLSPKIDKKFQEDTSKTLVTPDHKEYGYISFSHYPSLREDDSDESWNLDGTKLLVRIWKPQVQIHGHRMQYLELSEKSEETKRREDLLGMMKIQSPYEETIKQAEVKENFGRGKKKKKGKCTVQ
ncbi:hypothetical protein GCK72_011239 [Caenorhabditis remanei]|uniref:Uncharacterized protein n=1 Tax=Caenorhabditis remanei TaxID=31234 RepID=A0A6A5H847_CAERE|nr:hypothetical protein GCK72_011239 [Caenorhabditis remanei]KAF1762974.1 hypothetical protein GCK72_011239 [Caenorhabditis remanei]